MKQRRRIYYTDSQKALMWERSCSGKRPNSTVVQVVDDGDSRRYRMGAT